MKTYIKDGKALTLAAPYDVSSGGGLLAGTIFGVAHNDAVNGEEVVAMTCGVFQLTALTAAVTTQGAAAYWDDTNKQVTPSASGNTLIGSFTKAKTNSESTALVWLKP